MLTEFEFHGALSGDYHRCAGIDVAGLLLLGGLDLQRTEATEIDVIATDESVREDSATPSTAWRAVDLGRSGMRLQSSTAMSFFVIDFSFKFDCQLIYHVRPTLAFLHREGVI